MRSHRPRQAERERPPSGAGQGRGRIARVVDVLIQELPALHLLLTCSETEAQARAEGFWLGEFAWTRRGLLSEAFYLPCL